MKFTLTGYQEQAVKDALKGLRKATREFAEDHEYTSLSLAAPTGAGKTVIAAAVAERLFHGDDDHPKDPDATILWITDDPSLNEQTRRKMLLAASRLKPAQAVTLNAAFDQELLDAGKVYFLNIQKLAKGTSFVIGGTDARRYSFWTTIARTAAVRGGHFYVIIDEAHRGTGKASAPRPTIVRRIISDPEGVLPPAPVVWGISATPERFQEAMAAASTPPRVPREVRVDVDEVRSSGLLKDKILIKHPKGTQPSDATLTRLAVDDLRAMTETWAKYSADEREPPVMPALVVQVAAGVTDAAVATLLNTLGDAWDVLKGKGIGHSFETHTALSFGGHTVRYIAPQDIQDDTDLRVVLFKEALTTGWDCPRAEVMLSFRTAKDYTYIAQLIGRMVRTPLAKRIAAETEVLNTVGLYLPKYDDDAVDAVVERLRTDPDMAATSVERNPVTLQVRADLDPAVKQALLDLPTYTVPGRAHKSQVARLRALASRLVGDHIDDNALVTADEHLIETIAREAKRLDADGSLTGTVDRLSKISIATRSVSLRTGDDEVHTSEVAADSANIDDLLKAANRGLRDGLAKTYWGHLVDNGEDQDEAKLVTSALASEPTVVSAVETAAEELVQTWLKQHSRAISELKEARKNAYYAITAQARKEEPADLALIPEITASGDDPLWDKHVYADGKGKFPADLNGWETPVMEAELVPERDLLAWYRNPTGGRRAVRIPYEDNGVAKPFYPDFVLFHRDDEGQVVPSIVDPHRYTLADAAPKWRGLGKYAEAHGHRFRRIDAVIEDKAGALLRLDLKDPTVRGALTDVHGVEALLDVFAKHGGSYG